jgi:hypothetical protein
MSIPLANGFAEFTHSSVYISMFSGKLSSVMSNSEDPVRIEAQPVARSVPGHGEEPAVPPPLPKTREVGGREGPEPTRFGDWELRGRCIDF